MPLIIGFIIVLYVIYAVTVFIHLFGVPIFKRKKINLGLALIPFFYWFAREVKV